MKNGTYSTAKPRSAPRNAPAQRGEAETLAEVALGLTAEFDLKKLVQKVTDAGTALAGAQFGAFFYNVEDDAGQGYSLYTLTGAARDAFASTGLPRSTPLFESTFRGAGDFAQRRGARRTVVRSPRARHVHRARRASDQRARRTSGCRDRQRAPV